MTDARVVRTRAALHRAATRLASERAVSAITVSDLAAEAGINRATFYKHYISPNEALAAPLREDLAAVREDDRQEGASLAAVLDALLVATLDHVSRFSDVYETAASQPLDGVVSSVLTEHFTASVARFMESRDDLPADIVAVAPPLAAQYVGAGVAGALESWLASGSHDRAGVSAAISACLPAWAFTELPAQNAASPVSSRPMTS